MKKDYLITVYSGRSSRSTQPVFEERLNKPGKKFKKGYLKAVEDIFKRDNSFENEHTIYCNEIK